MLFRVQLTVLGFEVIEKSGPGKPGFALTVDALKEIKNPGCPPLVIPGKLKSFVQLAPGEHFVEIVIGAYKNGDRAEPFAQVKKVIKGSAKS